MTYNYVDPRARDDIRAHEGDEVWVVLNHVKSGQCETFEHFVHSILMPALAHLHPDVYNHTRVLHPASSNDDDTYTYIFIMDPIVANGDYDIANILTEYYTHDQAQDFLAVWEATLAKPQSRLMLHQSDW